VGSPRFLVFLWKLSLCWSSKAGWRPWFMLPQVCCVVWWCVLLVLRWLNSWR